MNDSTMTRSYFSSSHCAELIDKYRPVATPSDTCKDKENKSTHFLSLGWASYVLGNNEMSVDFFEKAAELGKDKKDKEMECRAYTNLAVVFEAVGQVKKSHDYSSKALDLVKTDEVTDLKQRRVLLNIQGTLYHNIRNFDGSIRCQEESLKISKELCDEQGEATSYYNLGTVYCTIGDYKRSIEMHMECYKRRQEIGDRFGLGISCMQLAYVHYKLCTRNYPRSIEYQEEALQIGKELGFAEMELTSYSNLGCLHLALAESKKAIEFYEKSLWCSRQTAGERTSATLRHLSRAYHSLGDHSRAVSFQERSLKIDGDKNEFICSASNSPVQEEIFEVTEVMEGDENHCFLIKRKGCSYTSQLNVIKSVEDSSDESIQIHEKLRQSHDDESKISLDNQCVPLYKAPASQFILFREPNKALFVLERGRAQALNDLITRTYAPNTVSRRIQSDTLRSLIQEQKCCFLFMTFLTRNLFLWFFDKEGKLTMRQYCDTDPQVKSTKDLLETQSREILETMKTDEDYDNPNEEKDRERGKKRDSCLRRLYKAIIARVAGLIKHHEEMVIVPEEQMWLVPFSCLKDKDGCYLSEKVRIRLSPSLTTLRLIQDSPADYHSQSGELIVGVLQVGVQTFRPLKFAKKEAEMIASLFGVQCLVGELATKEEVLRSIGEVHLVHIATHGSQERGEPALTLRPSHSQGPVMLEDFVLTVEEIASLKIRAKLVVLSLCYGGRGKLMTLEGVVGTARAFLGSGARAVLVSLWQVRDEAAYMFMYIFYQHLVRDKMSASKALQCAQQKMMTTDFPDEQDWAAFTLIGEDVTLD